MSKMTDRTIVLVVFVILLAMLARTLIQDAHYESPSPFNNGTVATPFPKNGALFLHKFHVYIVNDLPQDNTLDVSCRSKDIDKGSDVLDRTEVFEFDTRLNLPWTNTKYWCHITWQGGHLHNKTFWADYTFLEKCNFQHCAWYAREDGLYLKTILGEDYEKYYEWGEW